MPGMPVLATKTAAERPRSILGKPVSCYLAVSFRDTLTKTLEKVMPSYTKRDRRESALLGSRGRKRP